LVFSPDGKTVVSAALDGTATLWDVRSAKPLETLRGHSSAVQQAVFAPDGTTLYTVSSDGTAVAWDLTGTRAVERRFTFTHDRDFDEANDRHPGRFSPDGRLIAVGLKKRGIALWDARELAPAREPVLRTGGEIKALAFSPDGGTLAAVTDFGELTIWNVASRSLRHEPLYTAGGTYMGIGFSADGSTLATSGGDGARFWNVGAGASLGGIAAYDATDVALSADGALVALALAGSGVARAQVWDVATRSLVASLEGGEGTGDALSVALSPDGRTLAVGGYGRVVHLWDVRSRKIVHELDHGGAGSAALEFSGDGRILAVSGFGEPVASLWDVATGIQIGPRLSAGRRTAMMDLSSNGRQLLMAAANGQGAVWDVDPASWARRACRLANRTLTREEWGKFLPGRPYEPACR
jgi:WD40 repeat protein